jgi:zinc carboxypeptidase
MVRRSLCLVALSLVAAAGLGAAADDPEYGKKIKEYTTDPMFLTELVDHLPSSAKVPSPDKVLGYVVGTPEKLTYAKDVHRYFRELAKASPRVKVWSIGTTEEGREQILVAISDEANIARLDQLKKVAGRLGDPRGLGEAEAKTLVAEGRPFYWATGAMHSPETGSPEMLMELGYRLAVEESPFVQAIRKNVVVLMTPVLEVDGRERMVDVYRYRKENPKRTAPSLLYWGKYVAHDNNRDGLGLALKQSQNVMKTALEWHPTVIHDLHESVPFLYTSTGTGPYNAWLDPITIDEWNVLAFHEIEEMTKRGVPGVWTHGFYDGWAPNYMFYAANGHNAIGRFYETFGNGGADTRERVVRGQSERAWFRPNPPLPRVRWSMRNNINMQQSALMLALKFVGDNKDRFLNNFYLKSRRSIEKPSKEGPAAYVIPGDEPRQAGATDLLKALQVQGVEIHRATASFKVKEKTRDESAGPRARETEKEVEYPAGSYVIRMDQPYSRMADMLLDTQWYNVNDPRPYDDTGWTLGPLHNVKTVRVTDLAVLKAPMSPVTGDPTVAGTINGEGSFFVVDNRAESQLATLRFRLKDAKVEAAEEAFEAGGKKFGAGALLLSGVDRAKLAEAARGLGLSLMALPAAPKVKAHPLTVPRVAILHDWLNTQNEGWWRIAFDRYGVPYDYISVHEIKNNADLRSKWDVIVYPPVGASIPRQINGLQTADAVPWTPSEKYPNLGGPDKTDDMRGGLGYEGLAHLRTFAESGGLVIAAGGAAVLPVRVGMVEAVDSPETRTLQARGSVLRTTVTDHKSPIAYGYGETLGVYFNQSPIFEAGPSVSLGGGGRGGGGGGGDASPTQGRPSGRGGPRDPDIPQGRALVPPPEAERPVRTLADVPEDTPEGVRAQMPTAERLPRVVLRFAKRDDLWMSGMLDHGEELADKAAVIDCPVGKGHIVLFSNNPMWRWETLGSHALVFNAVMNWDQLGAGRVTRSAPAETTTSGPE